MPVLSLPLVAGRKYLPRGVPPRRVAPPREVHESILARAFRGRHPGAQDSEPARNPPERGRRTEPSAPELNPGDAPFPGPSPTSPTLRANPFPEVTDLVCRLPLPTFFYRLEAVHLGDQMRIWVRAGVKVRILSTAWIFKVRTGESRTQQEPLRSSGPRPSLRPTRSSQGPRPLNQKRQLFPDPRSAASPGRQRLAARLGSRLSYSPRPGSGMSTGFPFAEALGLKFLTTKGFRFLALQDNRSFRFRLRIDSPMCNCCSHGTLLHVSPQGSHLSICYYHQDLCRRRLQADSRPVPFCAHLRTPLLTAA